MTKLRFPRRVARIVLVAGVAGLLGGLAGVPVAVAAPTSPPTVPPSDISWSVAPSTASGKDTRTHFDYAGIKPGSVVHDHVGISNFSTKPVTFRVYAEDGVTTADGSIGLQSAAQKSVDIGAWVHLDQNTVTVPARAKLNMPFTVTVPANATPGDHVGGVIASVTQNVQAGKVTREDRVGVALYLRVNGPLRPAFGIESVSFGGYHGTPNPFGGGWTSVSYTVHNTGNVRLGGNQTVTVTGPFGIPLATVHPAALYELLPGGSVRVTARVNGIVPMGPMGVHVTVDPAVVPGSPGLTTPVQPVTYTVGMWATPWSQLLLLLVLIAIVWVVVRTLRRRRRRQADALAAAVEQGRREALASVGGRADESETPAQNGTEAE